MLNLYDVCIDISVGAISTIFRVVAQTLMQDIQLYIQGCIDFVIGNVSGVAKMVRGG